MKISKDYFLQDDVVSLAKSLIGCTMHSFIDGMYCCGIIVETEAYAGITDRASHAYGDRKTARTEVMYRSGGIAYIYFSYGMHHLFNVVTAAAGIPHAVLIRGLFPLVGEDFMQQRRGRKIAVADLANGPAKLTKSMGITLKHNCLSLDGNVIWFENEAPNLINKLVSGPRIGIDYAGEDALLPYRFVGILNNG